MFSWPLFTEVEKFIVTNMQELAKDKWLCPLSGKKFKGPEFVRKHILTKHLEKIGEVKKEVKLYVAFVWLYSIKCRFFSLICWLSFDIEFA